MTSDALTFVSKRLKLSTFELPVSHNSTKGRIVLHHRDVKRLKILTFQLLFSQRTTKGQIVLQHDSQQHLILNDLWALVFVLVNVFDI